MIDTSRSAHRSDQSASAIYSGTVRHRRFSPKRHEFTYRITMLMLDLDFADGDLNAAPLFSASKPSIGWFRRDDYVGEAGSDLKQTVLDQIENRIGHRPDGKVLLLTNLRYWGFVMNPISIFYCYDLSGDLRATALQVTNTPWREKILYVLPTNFHGRNHRCSFTKNLHVSPFNPMDMRYECRLRKPSDKLFFHLENHTNDSRITDATMCFSRKPLNRWRLAGLCLRQPAITLKVAFGIYWQALRLWLKRVPVFNHPAQPIDSKISLRH